MSSVIWLAWHMSSGREFLLNLHLIGPYSSRPFLEQSKKQREWVPYFACNVGTWERTPPGKIKKRKKPLPICVEPRLLEDFSFSNSQLFPFQSFQISGFQFKSSQYPLFRFFFIIYPYVALNVVVYKKWLAAQIHLTISVISRNTLKHFLEAFSPLLIKY